MKITNKIICLLCVFVSCACACGNNSLDIEKYLEQSTGVNGIVLAYADSDNAIFYSNKALFNYDISKKDIINILDFEENSIDYIQGDSAYSISASMTGDEIFFYGGNGINNLKYIIKDNELVEIDKNEISNLFSEYSEVTDYTDNYFEETPGIPEGPIVKNDNKMYYITDGQSLHKNTKLVVVSDNSYKEYSLFD